MNKLLFSLCLTLLSVSASAGTKEFCQAPPSTHARILCSKQQFSVKRQIQDEITNTLKKPKRQSVELPPLQEKTTSRTQSKNLPTSKTKPASKSKSSKTYSEPFTYKPYTPGAFSTPKKEK